MLPFADTHVHLLAGLDDGPRTPDEALAMCRAMAAEGTRFATALAHQNPDYPENTSDRIKEAATKLAADLKREGIPLHTYPTGEVMLTPITLEDWVFGRLQSVGGHGKFLLIEQPHDMFIDVRPLADAMRHRGVRLIIAHAERYTELTDDPVLTNGFLEAGCVFQVTAEEIADPRSPRLELVLKDWAKRGVIHLLGSDGHGPERRKPLMADGVRTLEKWIGTAATDRIVGIWGPAVLQGLPVTFSKPVQKSRNWFAKLFGG